ncbi:hypothetical protein B0H19DRAFT_1325024 [Mycena capillaripes]|nr:hypothetical protein B0H19DRAFT_1324763 [Mycena capillaripes]KAJ6533204.1 hypothetical protein B0H19DRAFT_1325024 [Mycena capillaripes]
MSINIPAATRPRSRIDMPPLHARGAPKKFTGRPHDITKFLSHCDKLFAMNNVFTNIEKVECMAEYCSRSVIHILEGMKPYTKPDWAVLCSHMAHMFDADKDLQRHRPSDLRKLTDKWRKLSIKNMSDWRKYLRQFTRIAGWLVQKQIIDEAESARYLWKGIPSHLRHVIENRLLAKDPKRDMTVPFGEDEIIGVVDAKFKRGRFDDDIGSEESGSDDSGSESDSDSESDLSDSDDELEYKKKKKSKSSKSKPAVKKQAKRTRDLHSSIIAPKAAPALPSIPNNSAEVGDLVKQLSKMSLEDPEYNYLYYKATKLDPLVVKCVRAPNLAVNMAPLPPNNFRNNRFVAPPNQLGHNTTHVHQTQAPPPPPGERTCWGCGDKGHNLWECPSMAEPLRNGELKRGERGIEWKDGALLRRFNQQGETLHHAYLRQRAEHLSQPEPAVHNNLAYTALAPITSDLTSGNEPILPVFVQAITSDDELTRIFSQETLDTTSVPAQHPVDEIQHRIDFSREDAIMEDEEDHNPDQVLKAANHLPKMSKRAGPRQSAVSAYIDPKDILNQVLNAKLDNFSTGQLLAVSPNVANALIDVLKLKNAARATATSHLIAEPHQTPSDDIHEAESIVAATFITRDRQRLIRLQVQINGKIVIAIVDTGSMLNVVSRAAWRTYMSHHSMDITRHINMGDANGVKPSCEAI